jgi:hypothetical protein
MNWNRKLEPFLLMLGVAISRFLFRSHKLYDLDSVNFALAMERFDPRVHQPHPPGYPLYIALARAVNHFCHDANLSLVILSIMASCGAIVYVYKLALRWFGIDEARAAAILFLLSPSGWFHGTVALTYSLEAFFSAALGYLCWKIEQSQTRWIVPTGVILGVSAGVRPSSLLFLGPLYLYSLRNARWSGRLTGIAALALTGIAWFLPTILAAGGAGVYFDALESLWRIVPSKNTLFNSSPATSIARLCFLVFMVVLNFGIASFAVISAMMRKIPSDTAKIRFTLVWIMPAICFFTLIFFQFINSGYLLLLSPPACLWLGLWTADWYRRCSKAIRAAVLSLFVATNVSVFLVAPLYCSYKSIRHFESELEDVQSSLPKLGSPNDTLVIGFDSHFLGYRHAGYYLPEYTTVEYPEVNLKEGTRVFAMHHRDTQLLEDLPIGSYKKFVLFPLPDGDSSYSAYMTKVVAQLPSQKLQTIRVGGKDFITGPVTLLPILFPHAVKHPAAQRVSTASLPVGCCIQP